MQYLACGVCGHLLATVVPAEPNGKLTLECPNNADGKEHTMVVIDLRMVGYMTDGKKLDGYGSGIGQQDIR